MRCIKKYKTVAEKNRDLKSMLMDLDREASKVELNMYIEKQTQCTAKTSKLK